MPKEKGGKKNQAETVERITEQKVLPIICLLYTSSKNTTAVRMAQVLGIDTCFNFLTDKLNVTTLDYTYDKAYSK